MNGKTNETGIGKRSVFAFMIGMIFFTLLFTAASLCTAAAANGFFGNRESEESSLAVSDGAPPRTVVIDPGHGGEDAGCSAGEVLEKDLNLSVSNDLYDLFSLFGIPVKMTRRDDVLLYDMYDDLEDYKGKKKIFDLKNRVRFAREEDGIYLGIHMNKFPESSVRGVQVYYSPNDEGSEKLADAIRGGVSDGLGAVNAREIKKAGSSIFVLKELTSPAVLVECGFLSNPEDLALLSDAEYRKKLAVCIFSSAASCEYGVRG